MNLEKEAMYHVYLVGKIYGYNLRTSMDRVYSLSKQDISTLSLAWVTQNSCGDNP